MRSNTIIVSCAEFHENNKIFLQLKNFTGNFHNKQNTNILMFKKTTVVVILLAMLNKKHA
jgi:hypothetical protein